MIADVIKKEMEKYQVKLDELIANRDAEIEKKCDILRAELKAVPNPEIEALQEVLAGLQKLIDREEAEQEAEQVVETPEADVSDEEPEIKETIVIKPVEAPKPVQETPAPEIKEEPKSLFKERPVIKNDKPSIFARFQSKAEEKKVETPADPPKAEKTIELKAEKVDKTGRAGMHGIFNPKRS